MRVALVGGFLLWSLEAVAQTPTPRPQKDPRTIQAEAARRDAVENAATDASLRSPLAVPKFEFSVEVADDKKTATAKMGFAWFHNLTGELGFSGVFDQKADRSPLTSLRRLSPDSSAWFAAAWKPVRISFDAVAMNAVCLQAAWASGQSFLDFDCRSSQLPDDSFADRIKGAAHTPPRALCQQFVRAMEYRKDNTGKQTIDCDHLDFAALERNYSDSYTKSYVARYEALVGIKDTAGAAKLCNEFRQSRGLPSAGAECDPADFSKSQALDFARSWKDRFASFASELAAAICDEYRMALGQDPTKMPDCTQLTPDPVFSQSFKKRFDATNKWLGNPVFNARVDVGRPAFKFSDASDLSRPQAEEDHYSYSFTGTAGWLTPSDLLTAINLIVGKSWKAADAVELCQPLSGTMAVTCEEDVALGPPTSKTKSLFELQIQRPIGPTAAAMFLTLNTKVTDVEHKHEWGIVAPFYFMKDKSGGLAGGVVFNYQHGPDKAGHMANRFEVSVFVGQVFKAH
jgi:hypothetical protein